MRYALLAFILITVGYISFTGYGLALIDWAGDGKTGMIQRKYWEPILKTGLISLYPYLAFRFALRKKMFSSGLFTTSFLN